MFPLFSPYKCLGKCGEEGERARGVHTFLFEHGICDRGNVEMAWDS